MMKRQQGFTLIELMIAVAAVGILAAIALPSYQGQLVKSRRGETQAFMMDVAQREQARFLDARSHVAVAANSEFDDANKLNMPVPDTVSKNYNVTVTLTCTPAPPPPCFRVTATPVAGRPQDKDGTLVLESNGNKSRKGDPALW